MLGIILHKNKMVPLSPAVPITHAVYYSPLLLSELEFSIEIVSVGFHQLTVLEIYIMALKFELLSDEWMTRFDCLIRVIDIMWWK